jgi:hypothetical protein
MRGRAVEVVIEFFYILAVVAFASGEAEQPFFQDGVFAVPQANGKAQALPFVADAGNAVFSPAVNP